MKDIFNRWIGILRHKASVYEHEARKRREPVTQPSLDDVCNEMNAYVEGFEDNEKK